MSVPYSIPTFLSSLLSHQILFSTCLVLCSKSKGSPAKFSQIRKDSWRPWANQRGGRKIKRMRRKRNGKPRVLGREKNSLPKMGRWEMPMSRQNRWIYWYTSTQAKAKALLLPVPSLHLFCLTLLPLCQRSLLHPSHTAKGHFPLFPLPVPCRTPPR